MILMLHSFLRKIINSELDSFIKKDYVSAEKYFERLHKIISTSFSLPDKSPSWFKANGRRILDINLYLHVET